MTHLENTTWVMGGRQLNLQTTHKQILCERKYTKYCMVIHVMNELLLII
jgi:hypothetical protein